jgi:hypothetical protein
LGEIAGYEICPICFWEDGGQDDPDDEENCGGPNKVSLSDGRRNYLRFGASDPKNADHCRVPQPNEERLRLFVIEGESVIEN